MPNDIFAGNLNRYLRMAQLFGEPMQNSNELMHNNNFDMSPPEDDFNADQRFSQLYHPDNRMSDKYYSMLDQFPERNHPGALRKIAATIASLGRPEDVERSLYAPYHRNLADWKEKINPLQRAAEIERQNNVNQRMVANQIISQEMGNRRLERQIGRDKTLEQQGNRRLGDQETAARTREDLASQRIRQADARLKLAEKIAKGGVFKEDDQGNAFMVYKDGTTEPIEGMEFLSAEDKAKLRQKYPSSSGGSRAIKTDVIEDPENPGKKVLVQIHEDGTYTIVKGREDKKPATPTTRTAESTASTELGKSREMLNRARKLKITRPDLSKWISINKGEIAPIPKPSFLPGRPTKAQYDEINKLLAGGEVAASPEVARTGAPTGRVKVVGPNGQTGTVDVKEASQLPRGWRIVQ